MSIPLDLQNHDFNNALDLYENYPGQVPSHRFFKDFTRDFRKLLGGKIIDCESMTYERPYKNSEKVEKIILLVVFFFLFVIFAICLLISMAQSGISKARVGIEKFCLAQDQKVQNVRAQFFGKLEAKDISGAEEIYNENRAMLAPHRDVKKALKLFEETEVKGKKLTVDQLSTLNDNEKAAAIKKEVLRIGEDLVKEVQQAKVLCQSMEGQSEEEVTHTYFRKVEASLEKFNKEIDIWKSYVDSLESSVQGGDQGDLAELTGTIEKIRADLDKKISDSISDQKKSATRAKETV